MADFWIKIEKGTPDKPEILELAAILNIEDPDTVTGKMIRVWSWFDSNSENGHAPTVTKVLLDRLTGVTGFTESLVTVGWLVKTDDGFSIPNFDRHLGKCAKKRASDAERKRKSRETSSKCHSKSVTKDETEIGLDKSRVDKIRKDIKDNRSVSFSLDFSCWPSKPSDQVLKDWLLMRKRLKANVTQTVVNRLAKQLHIAVGAGMSVDDCLSECVVRNWRGFEYEWVKNKPGGYGEGSFNGGNEAGRKLSAVERQQARIRAKYGSRCEQSGAGFRVVEDGGDLRGAVVEREGGGAIIDMDCSPEQVGYEPD